MCLTAVPLTPVALLDTPEGRLEAVLQVVDVVRGPLEVFYDSLSDEQRQHFENMDSRGNGQAPAGGDVAADNPLYTKRFVYYVGVAADRRRLRPWRRS